MKQVRFCLAHNQHVGLGFGKVQWNGLPDDLKSVENEAAFKLELKQYLWDNVLESK